MSKPSPKITSSTVQHIATLANIPVTDKEAQKLATGFAETLDTIKDLQSVNTSQTEPTHQVTGLENIWRKDEVDDSRTFTQQQALANAKHTHDGYFVVPRIIKK